MHNVQAVLSGARGTPYVTFNLADLDVRRGGGLFDVRAGFHHGIPETARGGMDIWHGTLLLLGNAGHGSGLHVDWTEAKNIAFAVVPDAEGGNLTEGARCDQPS